MNVIGITLIDLCETDCNLGIDLFDSYEKYHSSWSIRKDSLDCSSWHGVYEFARCIIVELARFSEPSFKKDIMKLRESFNGLILCDVVVNDENTISLSDDDSYLSSGIDAYQYLSAVQPQSLSIFPRLLTNFAIRRNLIGCDFCDITSAFKRIGQVYTASSPSKEHDELPKLVKDVLNQVGVGSRPVKGVYYIEGNFSVEGMFKRVIYDIDSNLINQDSSIVVICCINEDMPKGYVKFSATLSIQGVGLVLDDKKDIYRNAVSINVDDIPAFLKN